MDFKPTEEQQAIIEFMQTRKENLMIGALAGAAKTSTLVLIAKAIPNTQMLFLAFNKNIAEEMKKRLPSNCVASTLNSLGHRTWGSAISPRLRFTQDKVYNLLRREVDQLNAKAKEEAWEQFAEIKKAIDWGKACGYVPDKHHTNAKKLMGDDDFFGSLEEEPTGIMEHLVRAVTVESINQGMKGLIDYGDQILLPVLFPCMFDQFPLVGVDEAQDMSPLNHAFLKKLVKKRIVAVGDECQSIYAFRGADTESMAKLRNQFSMDRLDLSISFRCPQAVVREAWWRAPHMKWPEWAIEGQVRREPLDGWDAEFIPDGAAIICRNNAPLYSLAIKLLRAGRVPTVSGNDISKGLLKIMRRFGDPGMNQEETLMSIDSWLQDKLAKSRDDDKFYDQAASMKVFATQTNTLGEAMALAENVFARSGPVYLMTGHKSKGLEFDHVYILDKGLIRTEESRQEENLLYVAQTRAKKSLTYITSEGYQA